MTDAPKPVAKSLHTLTVLVQVSRSLAKFTNDDPPEALSHAMRVLGLTGRPDPYELRAKALAALTAR